MIPIPFAICIRFATPFLILIHTDLLCLGGVLRSMRLLYFLYKSSEWVKMSFFPGPGRKIVTSFFFDNGAWKFFLIFYLFIVWKLFPYINRLKKDPPLRESYIFFRSWKKTTGFLSKRRNEWFWRCFTKKIPYLVIHMYYMCFLSWFTF